METFAIEGFSSGQYGEATDDEAQVIAQVIQAHVDAYIVDNALDVQTRIVSDTASNSGYDDDISRIADYVNACWIEWMRGHDELADAVASHDWERVTALVESHLRDDDDTDGLSDWLSHGDWSGDETPQMVAREWQGLLADEVEV